MKTTFLVYKDINADKKELRIATHDEWDAILKANKGLPIEQRRFFIKDCINEGTAGLDCMYIETSRDEYSKWNAEHLSSERNRKYKKMYQVLSLDIKMAGDTNEEIFLADMIADDTNIEDELICREMFIELQEKLSGWKLWANELLDCILSDNEEAVSADISIKRNVSLRMVRYRKEELRKFISNYLKNDFRFDD